MTRLEEVLAHRAEANFQGLTSTGCLPTNGRIESRRDLATSDYIAHRAVIINIGGLSARQSGTISGLRNAAIVHLTKTLSDQLGPDGITVNLVHPGTTRTERTAPMLEEQARQQGITVEEAERCMARNNAIRRIVDASEVAHVVTFLASTRAAAITGEVISAGGGAGRAVFQ